MSYSEEEVLKSSEDSGWNSSGTWNNYGSKSYYTNRSSHPEYSNAWSTYATLTKPSLASKPSRRKDVDTFVPSNGVSSSHSLSQQQQFSKSQHALNYYSASNHQVNHPTNRHSTRRFSEDESSYMSTSIGSPSSFSQNSSNVQQHVHSNVQRIPHKPLPPAKPPRNSISSRSYTSSSSSSKSSALRQEFTQNWHKSIDLDHTLPPPEGYGNIRRSASNDVDGFASSFRHSNAANSSGNYREYSIVPCDPSLVNSFLSNHLYDEITSHRQPHLHKQQQQQQPPPQQQQHQNHHASHHHGHHHQAPPPQVASITNSSSSNDNLDCHSRSFNNDNSLSTFTSNRLADQLHRSRQHSSWNYSSSNDQYQQQMQEVRAAIQAEVQKHVRSRSSHHTRSCNNEFKQDASPASDQHQNVYETPNRIRESSLNRTNSSWSNNINNNNNNNQVSIDTQSLQSTIFKCENVLPVEISKQRMEPVGEIRKPVQSSRAIVADEYATVMHPPPSDVAMKSIRAVIKPLYQEHKKRRKRKKSISTCIEDHLFASIDENGKKVTVKDKTLDKIPLLKDKSVMTDPVPDELFAQSENPFAVLSRTSKVTCEDGKRSLRRTKHHQFVHVGTAERRKKKFSLSQAQDARRRETRCVRDSSMTTDGEVESVKPLPSQEPIIVIKPIEIEEPEEIVAKTVSPFDGKEWEEIESLMASFESTFHRSPLSLSDQEFTTTATGTRSDFKSSPCPPSSSGKDVIHESLLRKKDTHKSLAPLSPGLDGVKNFLFSLDLPDYTPLLMANGFDDVRFMGPNVMEAGDLSELGIKNEQHVMKIISSARKLFPKLKSLDKKVDVSVENWLKMLNLEEYLDRFLENGFDDITRVRKVWEVELQAVLEISKVGHRKRILAHLGERLSLMTDLGLDDLDFGSVVESCMRSRSKTPDASGRKSTPQRSPLPVNILSVATVTKDASTTTAASNSSLGTDPSAVTSSRRTFSPENVAVNQIEIARNTTTSTAAAASSSSALSLTIASVPQWKHDPRQLVEQRVSYTAFYLGSTLVRQLLGIESTRESIKKLKETTKEQAKIPVVVLSISYTGVQFIDGQLNQIVCEHEIRNIHCACQDTDDFKHFAYITKDHESSNHYCHVFAALNLDLATEVILTLGQAFEVAYQLALGTDIDELSRIYSQVKESHLLKSAGSTQMPSVEQETGEKVQESAKTSHDTESTTVNSSQCVRSDAGAAESADSLPRRNVVSEQLKQLQSIKSDSRASSSGIKSSRTRSKSSEGVVGALSRTFEDAGKSINSNGSSFDGSNVPAIASANRTNESAKLSAFNGKAKPIPPAKPASLIRFPVSPALERSRKSDQF